ncbi:hypothetical protein HID58_047295, partial [Brassica napus]
KDLGNWHNETYSKQKPMEFVLVDGSKLINACSNPELNKLNQYKKVQKKENYVNVLANEEKFKLLEWMKNNMFSRGPESARDPECCSICHFVWDPKSKTWQPKYEK